MSAVHNRSEEQLAMNFSQRMGLEPAIKPLQKDSMDRELRASLWNAFEMLLVPSFAREWYLMRGSTLDGLSRDFFVSLWVNFYKRPMHTLPADGETALNVVRTWFLADERTTWDRIYQFVEFVANLSGGLKDQASGFVKACNVVLERENSACRFVGMTLAPITSDTEIKAIEDAASAEAGVLSPVSTHAKAALRLLSR
jgi:hypothetical protein